MTFDGSDLAILVPMLGRADRVPRLLRSIRDATPAAEVVLIACGDDPLLLGFDFQTGAAPAWATAGVTVEIVHDWSGGCPGDYGRKMNRGLRSTTRPWLFLGAIDLCFCPDWYDRAREVAASTGATVIGTNDLCNPRTAQRRQALPHSTHSLVHRSYPETYGTADEPDSGKVLVECYPHEFVDDEFVRTARYRGRYAHAYDAHVEHLHPTCGKEADDPLYAAQGSRIAAGRAIFLARQHLWEGTVR